MNEAIDMTIDVFLTVIFAACSIMSYMYLATAEPYTMTVFVFVVVLLLACVSALGTVAGIQAVASYFFE